MHHLPLSFAPLPGFLSLLLKVVSSPELGYGVGGQLTPPRADHGESQLAAIARYTPPSRETFSQSDSRSQHTFPQLHTQCCEPHCDPKVTCSFSSYVLLPSCPMCRCFSALRHHTDPGSMLSPGAGQVKGARELTPTEATLDQ